MIHLSQRSDVGRKTSTSRGRRYYITAPRYRILYFTVDPSRNYFGLDFCAAERRSAVLRRVRPSRVISLWDVSVAYVNDSRENAATSDTIWSARCNCTLIGDCCFFFLTKFDTIAIPTYKGSVQQIAKLVTFIWSLYFRHHISAGRACVLLLLFITLAKCGLNWDFKMKNPFELNFNPRYCRQCL